MENQQKQNPKHAKQPSRKGRLAVFSGLAVLLLAGLLLWKQGLLPGTEKDVFVIPEHIVICLDAGHGGDDPGAVLQERTEKDDNLRMALAVRDKLEDFGSDRVEVLLTREDDSALELQERVDIANNANATLFVALHRNSGGGTGVEVWTSAEAENAECRLANYIMDALEFFQKYRSKVSQINNKNKLR